MQRKNGFWERLRNPLLLGALILVLVFAGLLAYGAVYHKNHAEDTPLEKGLGAAVTWVGSGFAKMGNGIAHLFRGPYWNAEQVEEYLALKQEVTALRSEVIEMEELRRENARLLELLGEDGEEREDDSIFARVINRDQHAESSVLVLDKGASDGICEDDVVLDDAGLVGRVTEVGATWCRVMTAISGDAGVPALVAATRDPGVVKGNAAQSDPERLLLLHYLPDGAVINVGDRVLTSGMGGVYPKGLLIGTVSCVERDTAQAGAVVISPAADFVHLEEVRVLRADTQKIPTEDAN